MFPLKQALSLSAYTRRASLRVTRRASRHATLQASQHATRRASTLSTRRTSRRLHQPTSPPHILNTYKHTSSKNPQELKYRITEDETSSPTVANNILKNTKNNMKNESTSHMKKVSKPQCH